MELSSIETHAAPPLPKGGQFVAGIGSISGGGQSLTINQTTSRGVINWSSFSIGNGRAVMFNNGSGATLNRVTGGDPSVILGALNASGSVYLINPQGVLVGPTVVIATGGRFVASALDVDNNAFMQGGARERRRRESGTHRVERGRCLPRLAHARGEPRPASMRRRALPNSRQAARCCCRMHRAASRYSCRRAAAARG
ncbi:hypothetical protein CBA19CS11_37300 [Caballeronia novacaledonica]|nr:hypothetical protein CBA19CS11_37300 [Caballeronia novacaledonica]